MGQPVACQQCGAAFLMTVVTNPPPSCPQCGGTLAAIQRPDLYGQPASPTPYSDPLQTAYGSPWQQSPYSQSSGQAPFGTLPAKPQPITGLPVMALVGIGAVAGVGLLLVMLIALWPKAKPAVANHPPVPPAEVAPPFVAPSMPPFGAASHASAPPAPSLNAPPPSTLPQSASAAATTASTTPMPPSENGEKGGRGSLGKISSGGPGFSHLGSSNAFNPQKAFEPRVPWSVSPDPLATPLEFPATEKPLVVNLETRGHSTRTVFSHRPSYFVAVALDDFRNKQIRVYDLRTGKAPNKFPGEVAHETAHSALSSDGKYMATFVRSPERILVANTKTGKVVQGIELEKGRNVDDVAFAGDTQLIAVINESFDKHYVGIWDVEQGESLAEFKLEIPSADRFSARRYQQHSLAISPGGKYFAVLMGNVVCIHAASTGELVGELALDSDGSWSSNSGLEFSPTGDELAVVGGSSARTIHRIDLKTGVVTHSVPVLVGDFDRLPFHRGGKSIQFLPEISCFLVDGALVVEGTTGEAVFGVRAFEGASRVLPKNRLVGKYHNEAGGNVSAFGEFRLPQAEIEKLTAILRNGGTLFDGLLGEAKDGDLSGAEMLPPPPADMEWHLEVQAPAKGGIAKKAINLPTPESGWEGNTELLLSATGTKFAWLPVRREAHSRLWVADAVTGKLEGDIDVLPRSRAVDVSPDGSLVLVAVSKDAQRDDLKARRLEVYSIPLKKHVFAWKVDAQLAPSTGERPSGGSVFSEAYFIEKNLVLTRLDGGRLTLWSLPDAKAKYVLDGKLQIVGFSPGRRYALLHYREQQMLRWLEVKTGKWCGQWQYNGYQEPTLVFSPTGDQIAQVITANGYTQIRIFDTASGEQKKEFAIPPLYVASDRISWNDDRYLLIDRIVFDVDKGAPAWQYMVMGQPLVGPDGRFWFVERGRGSTTVTPSEVPSSSVLSRIEKTNPIPVVPLIGEGTRIAVQIGSLAGGLNPADAQRNLEEQIRSRGWVVDPNGPFRLTASSAEQAGKTVTYQGRGTTENVALREVKTTYSIVDNTGREVWKVEFTAGMNAPFFVRTAEGTTVQQELNKSFEGSLKSAVSGNGIPAIIFPADAYTRLPQSRHSAKGEDSR